MVIEGVYECELRAFLVTCYRTSHLQGMTHHQDMIGQGRAGQEITAHTKLSMMTCNASKYNRTNLLHYAVQPATELLEGDICNTTHNATSHESLDKYVRTSR